MQGVIHAGAHMTDEDRLIACLRENSAALRARGTHVPDPESDGEYFIPFGRARVAREGTDVTLVSWGRPVNFCLQAAETLVQEEIEAEVLDMRTIRPLDIDAIVSSLKKTTRVVLVDQCWPFGSVASETIAQICEHGFDYLDAPPVRVNTADVPTPYAKNLEEAYLPNPTRIAEAARNLIDATA